MPPAAASNATSDVDETAAQNAKMLAVIASALGLLLCVVIGVLVCVCKRLRRRRPKILLSSGQGGVTVVNSSAGVQLNDFDVVGTTTTPGVDVGAKSAERGQGAASSASGAHAKTASPPAERKVAKKPLINSGAHGGSSETSFATTQI